LSWRWLIRRAGGSLLVLLAALVVNFAIPRLMPGSPIDVFSGGVKLTLEAKQALVERFGLDAPLPEQFFSYFVNALRGDFGLSFYYFPRSVTSILMESLPRTLLVVLASLLLQVAIGYFLGVTAAWKAGARTDSILQTSSIIIFSTPLFWVSMVLLYVLGFRLELFPLGGCYTVGADYANVFAQATDILRHAALPILSLTISHYASYQLILRNTMAGVLKEQYIITAEAKGLSSSCVKHRHAARNALLPTLTFLGVSFAMSIGSSVFIETVFSYPGIGKLMYDSVMSRDYPVLQGCFFIFSCLVIGANFAVDVIYHFLDPRIRY
jgi:peptide/nickel transport system permease protein